MSLDVSTQRTIDIFSPHGGSVLISDVVIGETRRQVKSDYVQKLADSIKQIGLINPITIAPDNRLIAGYHRPVIKRAIKPTHSTRFRRRLLCDNGRCETCYGKLFAGPYVESCGINL